MLFTDLSSERVIKAFSKVGFRIIKQGKHIGMSDGTHRLTIPRHKRLIIHCDHLLEMLV